MHLEAIIWYNRLYADIDSGHFLGTLNVSPEEWRPYRSVEFLILDTRKDSLQTPAFVYQDTEQDTIPAIIGKLDQGIRVLLGI